MTPYDQCHTKQRELPTREAGLHVDGRTLDHAPTPAGEEVTEVMRRRRAAGTALVLGMALALFATGCGDDADVAANDGAQMADDMTADGGAMTDMDAGHDHEHDAMDLKAWPGDAPAPTMAIDVMAHEGGDVHITLLIDGFTILASGADQTSATEGHVHVSLDGAEAQMYFGTDIDLVGVTPGPHQVVVTLSAPDHTTLAIDDAPLMFAQSFTVPGEVAAADVVIAIDVDADGHVAEVVEASASIGDLVQLTVTSAVDEEIHVHAYDRTLELHAGEPAELQFVADIPGVIDIELEGNGVLVAELSVR